MTLILTDEEIYTVLHSALCNGGIDMLGLSGLEIDYNNADYKAARQTLLDAGINPCLEDVYIQMLKEDKRLSFEDVEGGDGEKFDLTFEQAKVNLANPKVAEHVLATINEEDDGGTADCILQFAMFNEIVYG